MELFDMGRFITVFLFACSDAASMFGEILSPNYPETYPNDTLESWEISVPPGYGIRLYFTHLDIEPSQNCEYDSVKVLAEDHLEGQLCGRKKNDAPGSKTLKEFYVPYNTLTVTFQSDFSNEERFTGFVAYYVAVDMNECTEFVEKVCSHYCHNYIGGYFCTCPPPYILYEDRKTCGDAPVNSSSSGPAKTSVAISCPQNVTKNSVLDPKRERYVFKDSVKVTCLEGYEIVTPQSTFTFFYSTCQGDGAWRDSHLECEPVECGMPDDVENADVHYITGPGKTQYQAEIRYDCHTYYTPENNRSSIYRCSATRQWVDENQKTELPVCIPVCGVPRNPIQNIGRIFGGTRAERGNFPWQIFFQSPRAGGALIADRWVLTTASVLEGNLNPTMYAGLFSIGPQSLQTAEPLVVGEVFIHPGWKEATGEFRTDFDNDIALVRLKKPVKMSPTVSTICLPGASSEYDPPERKLGYITGWGTTADGMRSATLRKAWIPVVNMQQCRSVKADSSLDSSAYRFTDNMICAGDGQSDSCAGDGGGAYAMVDPHEETRYYVAGLVSWGPKCGTYGLYTKVANYVAWITEVMNRQPAEEEE